jgi:hypothetical protein
MVLGFRLLGSSLGLGGQADMYVCRIIVMYCV